MKLLLLLQTLLTSSNFQATHLAAFSRQKLSLPEVLVPLFESPYFHPSFCPLPYETHKNWGGAYTFVMTPNKRLARSKNGRLEQECVTPEIGLNYWTILKIVTHTAQLHVDINIAKHVPGVLFSIILTRLWASIGVTRSYSSRPFLCALARSYCLYYVRFPPPGQQPFLLHHCKHYTGYIIICTLSFTYIHAGHPLQFRGVFVWHLADGYAQSVRLLWSGSGVLFQQDGGPAETETPHPSL